MKVKEAQSVLVVLKNQKDSFENTSIIIYSYLLTVPRNFFNEISYNADKK